MCARNDLSLKGRAGKGFEGYWGESGSFGGENLKDCAGAVVQSGGGIRSGLSEVEALGV